MNKLDPRAVFERLDKDFAKPLHKHLLVVGSLAAAYHFRTALEDHSVNTKDADIVVHPAGHVTSCKAIAEKLFADEWVRRDTSYPQKKREPLGDLRTIRVYPPRSKQYFVEFLGVPAKEQREPIRWNAVKIVASGHAGWYGLPCFRFMGLATVGFIASHAGIPYADPRMMALANLLSHEELGDQEMSTPIEGRSILRSAKDLGRVLAIAHLSGTEEVESWKSSWLTGLKREFPKSWRALGARAGSGLSELMADRNAFEQAHHTTRVGLLRGMGITQENLRVVGEQVVENALEPLAKACSAP